MAVDQSGTCDEQVLAGDWLLANAAPMFGYTVSRVRDRNLEPRVPRGSIVLFSRRRVPKRGDVVLVDHPEFGRFIKRVSAIGRRGGVFFRVERGESSAIGKVDRVSRDMVVGVMVRRIG